MDSIELGHLKNLFEQKVIEDINNIYIKFKDFKIFQKFIKVIEQNASSEKLFDTEESKQKKNIEIPEYMKFFVENLIERISSILEDKIYINSLNNNYNVQIVVGYLFKIIKSNFNFFPSHRLVLIIYECLCYSIWNDENISNFINKYTTELNKDLCECFLSDYIKIENKNNIVLNYNINEKNNFTNNIGAIELLKEQFKINNKPYLDFFIKFKNKCYPKDKYYYIMVINYLKKFSKHNNVDLKICLYSLLNYLKKHNYFKEIYDESNIMDISNELNKKLMNEKVKNIIQYSLKILTSKTLEDIHKIGKEINDIECTRPKISDKFNNTKEYYEDILNNLYYNIKQIKEIPNIFYRTQEKKYWCCIIKLLDLLLDDDIINDTSVKLIFYFIVTLLNNDLGFLTEKDFISNIFNSFICVIFNNKMNILLYPEISFLFINDQEFYDIFFNSENEEYYYNKTDNIIIAYNINLFKNKDISIMNDYQFKNKFLWLYKDLYQSSVESYIGVNDFYNSYKISKMNNKYSNIIHILYFYYNRILEEDCEEIDLNITENNYSKINKIRQYISQALFDENFLKLIKNIVKSDVVKEAYKIIRQKDIEENKEHTNFNILNYYNDFCNSIDNKINKELFIFMDLSTDYKAFTFRFLKIIINTSNISFKLQKNDFKENITLIKAFLIFLILHELNHLIKRLPNIDKDSDKVMTPRKEGGKELIELLFGNHLLNRNINIEQANYILDYGNWFGSLSSFCGGYKSIKNDYKGNSICYDLNEYDSICYDGFLRINYNN